MQDILAPAPAETCGNCKFGRRADITQVECNGVPPTPVVTAARANALGQPQMAIQLFRPIQPADTKACALWKAGAQIIDLGALKMAGGA